MSDHECDPLNFRVTYPGPFQHYDVVVDGWQVPLITAHMAAEDRVMLVIDGRLGAEFSVQEAERLVPFLADAISVALGYGAHPREQDHPPRPLERGPLVRPRRMVSVTGVDIDAGSGEGGE